MCQEGCQCDEGLMSDGVQCVPVEKCGCVVDGLYYKVNIIIIIHIIFFNIMPIKHMRVYRYLGKLLVVCLDELCYEMYI